MAAVVGVALAVCSSAATAGVRGERTGHSALQSCVTRVFRGDPTAADAVEGSAAAAVKGPFSALKRAVASSDSYTAEPTLTELLGAAGADSFDPGDVRQLTSSDGTEVYAVPVDLRPIVASPACSGLAGIASLLKLQTDQYGSGPGLCVVAASGSAVGTAHCIGITALHSYYGAARILMANGGGAFSMSPDGVSRVDLTFSGGGVESGAVSSNLAKLPRSGDVAVEGMSLARATTTLEADLPTAITELNDNGRVIATLTRPAAAVKLYLTAEGFVIKPKPKPAPTVTTTSAPATATVTVTAPAPTRKPAPSTGATSRATASCNAHGVCRAVFRSRTCTAGSTARRSSCTTVTETTVCTARHRCHTTVTTARTKITTRQEIGRAVASADAP